MLFARSIALERHERVSLRGSAKGREKRKGGEESFWKGSLPFIPPRVRK